MLAGRLGPRHENDSLRMPKLHEALSLKPEAVSNNLLLLSFPTFEIERMSEANSQGGSGDECGSSTQPRNGGGSRQPPNQGSRGREGAIQPPRRGKLFKKIVADICDFSFNPSTAK